MLHDHMDICSQMKRVGERIVLVGAFPPPIHGMAAVNAIVRDALFLAGAKPLVINLAARNLERSLAARLGRLPVAVCGILAFVFARRLRGETLYMSVSGGTGQVYEAMFVLLGRMRGMRLFLHHHSFAYLDRRNPLTAWLTRIAGGEAVHITQSSRMAARLTTLYGVQHAIAVSNAAIFMPDSIPPSAARRHVRTLGFISNIAEEKGVFEFLDLLAAAKEKGLPLAGKLAGPFQDSATERQVHRRLETLTNVEYAGAKYGAEKDVFFDEIDVLVFPTLYANETEGIVNHEAMSRSLPVIAYGRGAIPEIVGPDCGKVIDPARPFVPEALTQLEDWLADPAAFEAASKRARERFAETYAHSLVQWQALLADLSGVAGGISNEEAP